jgi:integrase
VTAKIRTIELADGSKRYRFTADVGQHPDGRRRQQTFTFTRKKDAEAELAKIVHQRREGTYVARWNGTVADVLDDYLAAKKLKEANTRQNYHYALLPARERLGQRKAQGITAKDIEQLRDWMLAEGRKRSGKPGTGLGVRSVRLTIGRVRAAFELACDRGQLYRNPCRGVELPELDTAERETWSAAEVQAFLAAAADHRLHAAWRLTLYGLRRAEVCGLRWADIDLDAGALTICQTRPVVGGKPIVKKPKSRRGSRTLPLDGHLVAALRALRKRQAAEQLAAGEAYQASGYVVSEELGAAVHPDWYSDEWDRLRKRAELRRIRLNDGRHTANSLMAAAGVPDHIRAAWCGHTVAVNVGTYTHTRPEDLGQALGALTGVVNAM